MSSQRLSVYKRQLKVLHEELGLPESYMDACGLELQQECENLLETELDLFSRQPLMEVDTYQAWQKMNF